MKGLLLKDFYVFIKQSKFFLGIILLYILLPLLGESNTFFLPLAVLITAMLPVTLLSYDERSKWDRYALTMPFGRRNIIISKYLFGALLSGAVSVLICVSQIVYQYVRFQVFDMSTVYFICMVFAGSLVYISVNLPVMFWLGVEKGRIWGIILVVLFMGSMGVFFSGSNAVSSVVGEGSPLLLLALPAAVLVMALSAAVSVALYQKKEF